VIVAATIAVLVDRWTLAFWSVTVGAACIGHAVISGFGLLDRAYLEIAQ
jgi:hypothetical protein